MTIVDLGVVVLGVAVLLFAGFGASRWSSRRTTDDFILGGRRLPWWLGGAAAAAGSSNADSPLHQSGKINREGLTGGWFYWCQLFAAIWHALVFSRLWRRTGVKTVVEFYDLRYASRGGRFARQWSMAIGTLLAGILHLAVGLLAMIKISQVLLGVTEPLVIGGFALAPELAIALGGLALALGYSVVSGLLGVIAGDLVEFLLLIACSYALMFFAYRAVGYSSGLREGLAAISRDEWLSFAPVGGIAFVVLFLVQPFATLSQSNSVNQNFLIVKDERHAVFTGIWRLMNHFFVRSWPWYICGLASVLLVPQLLTSEDAYPALIQRLMPEGWRGLMFAGFLVAFMSSSCRTVHASGSVFVNDFYRVYVVRRASERHYVWAIRVAMLAITAVATSVALASDEILRLVQLAMSIAAASGVVMLMRWFWWRVNGWADLAAQVTALPVTLHFTYGPGTETVAQLARQLGSGSGDDTYSVAFLLSFIVTNLVWIAVMYATRPEPASKLCFFFRHVRPYGFWQPIAKACPEAKVTDRFTLDLYRYGCGLVFSIGMLFGIGLLLLGRPAFALTLILAASVAGVVLVRSINRDYAQPRE